MTQKLIIKGRLPGLNEIINADRTNRHIGAKLKKEWTELVAWECKRQKLIPVDKADFEFTWIEQNMRRDKDNIASGGHKMIFDGLVTAGILTGDGWKQIGNFSDKFYTQGYGEGVIVLITSY